jgi:hypothetical protein
VVAATTVADIPAVATPAADTREEEAVAGVDAAAVAVSAVAERSFMTPSSLPRTK